MESGDVLLLLLYPSLRNPNLSQQVSNTAIFRLRSPVYPTDNRQAVFQMDFHVNGCNYSVGIELTYAYHSNSLVSKSRTTIVF